MFAPRRAAFSFIELLVVITIIGVLVAMLLPAVQSAREAARRSSCSNNLSQLIVAVHNYESLHGRYPPGTIEAQGPIRSVAQGYHHNWIVQILPQLEERSTWSHVDPTVGVYHPNNAPVARLWLDVLQCPSQPTTRTPQSCYAGVHHDREAPIDVDNHGVFHLNSRVRYEDVTDGSAHTIFIGEILAENGGLGWMSGTRATLRNAGVGFGMAGRPQAGGAPIAENAVISILEDLNAGNKTQTKRIDPALVVGSFASLHAGGVQYAFGDGHVQFLSSGGAANVMRLLAHRADGKLLDGEAY